MNLLETFENELSKAFRTPSKNLDGNKSPISGSGFDTYKSILNKYDDLVEDECMECEKSEETSSGSSGGFVGPLSTNEDEEISGGLSKGMTIADLAKKHNVKVGDIKSQIKKGIKVEMEHTEDKKVAKEIAMDHLYEDPKYYDKLKKIETKEATTTASSGAYESPAAWAKSTKKKDWAGKSDKMKYVKGGKFVKIKEKCKTFPYCNQGDVSNMKIFENLRLKKIISNISEKYNISENVIKAVIIDRLENKNK